MSEPLNASVASGEADLHVAEVIAEITDRMRTGELLDVSKYLSRYPELEDRLRPMLATLDMLAQFSSSTGSDRPSSGSVAGEELGGTLGDFRILREVGKGGMGIVYEAEQISLRRRVALKVLPFAATMDPRYLQRFHNEAQAAACLHHTNIVPVYCVASERGIHFYAMQFIDGQPLSDLIRQLQHAEKKTPTRGEESTAAYQPAADEAPWTPLPAAEMTPITGEGRRSLDYYRKVAELGLQAAEALDHAHQLGIVHRDIKPANLLLDGRSNVWVTDFGLAHLQHSEANLTLTGQAVGTPRYMSPEQARAKRVPIDHRTDVYSLGVTLYELLTLRPAFESDDREELQRQIAFEEPPRPRRLERSVPAELEIIVLKATEKRPQDRYATAQELADDLRRWLLDQPIRARRPSWSQVARRWMRRHQSAVWTASLALLVVLIVGTGVALWRIQQQKEVETEARLAFDEAVRLQKEERWSEALSAIHRAQAVLRGFGSDARLRQQADELAKDLEMVQRLEEAQLQHTAIKDGHYDYEGSFAAYREAFAWYGLDVEHLNAGEAAEYIRSRSIQNELVAALDQWIRSKRSMKGQEWKHVLAVVLAVDADQWRNRWRDAWERRDGRAMRKLLASVDVEKISLTTVRLLVVSSRRHKKGFDEQAATVLRRAQQRHPADFWINRNLAVLLATAEPPQLEEAIGYFRVAVAVRPQSPGVHADLGFALKVKGRLDAAIAQYREAIRLKKDYATAHNDLGTALHEQDRLDAAIAEWRQAIRLKKDYAEAHYNLGAALREKGQLDAAIAECREAIRLKKDYAEAHSNLGIALKDKGRLDEAIAECREAIRLKKESAEAHHNLANALREKGQLDEAIAEWRQAIRLKKDDASTHNNLGSALADKGRLDAAIAEWREAIRLKKDDAIAHNNLGAALREKGQLDEAIAECREAIRLKEDDAIAHYNLGFVLMLKDSLHEAITEFREAIQLNKDFALARNKLRQAEQMARLGDRLPRILEGKEQPKNAAECLAFASLCQQRYKQRFAAATRFYSDAFGEEPKLADDLKAPHRYNAACAAALAGCGQGKDADKLNTKERVRLRRQAFDWLRADLTAYRQVLEKSAGKAGPLIAQRMQHWLQDGDFAGVRGDDALTNLPQEESSAWRKLWADVAELLVKAQGKTPGQKKPNTKKQSRDDTHAERVRPGTRSKSARTETNE